MPPNIFGDTPFYGAVGWVTLAYIFVVAVFPWIGGRRSGPRGVMTSTAIALLVLGVLCCLLILQCKVGFCGHGAMILVPLLALAGIAGVLTIISAALAWYQWRK